MCICDTFFHHVDVFVSAAKVERNVMNWRDVEQALNTGAERSNASKPENKKLDVRVFRKNLLHERGEWQNMLVVESIQSSCGINYFVDEDTIVNHLFPDAGNKRCGRIESKKIKSKRRKRTTVARYRKVEETETDIDIIQRQHEARELIKASFKRI